MRWAAVLVFATVAWAQRLPADVYRVDAPGIQPPKVTHRVNAAYTPEARAARIQGIVLLEFVVNERGEPENITVVSPLAKGLNEQAVAALEQWRFRPGRKDGAPVKVLDTAEILFRYRTRAYFDMSAERRRAQFNAAMREFATRDPQRREAMITKIRELAEKKYPPAMYRWAKLLQAGNGVRRDLEQAREFLLKAAEKKFNSAIFEVGRMYLEGQGVARDDEKGRSMIRAAAIQGSVPAQYFLGAAYEAGKEYPQSDDSARQYFRMCATLGQVQCQYRIGRLLLDREGRAERDYVQALAWLELAASQGERRARILLDRERPKLTAEQAEDVEGFRESLLRR